jgi:hypothetical protein
MAVPMSPHWPELLYLVAQGLDKSFDYKKILKAFKKGGLMLDVICCLSNLPVIVASVCAVALDMRPDRGAPMLQSSAATATWWRTRSWGMSSSCRATSARM